MGLFDTVTGVDVRCPECRAEVEYQTKDDEWPCMSRVDYRTVEHFYGLCLRCRTWVEFVVREDVGVRLSLDDYRMTVEFE